VDEVVTLVVEVEVLFLNVSGVPPMRATVDADFNAHDDFFFWLVLV
jgi:hypothetical protein